MVWCQTENLLEMRKGSVYVILIIETQPTHEECVCICLIRSQYVAANRTRNINNSISRFSTESNLLGHFFGFLIASEQG